MFAWGGVLEAATIQGSTFPGIGGWLTSATTTAGTSHVVSLPAALSAPAASGNRLIVAFGYDATLSPSRTWPAGWTSVTTGTATALVGLDVYERIADGTEGASITITTGASCESQSVAWRMIAVHASTISEGATANSTLGTTTPDPPNLDPAGWGTENTAWLAIAVTAVAEPVTAYPSTFVENRYTANSGGATGVGIGFCMLRSAAGSVDPGTFTLASSRAWVAATIAVRQVVAGATPSTTQFLAMMGCGV